MADRRYLARDITDSGQVEALVRSLGGRDGLWSALLFSWLIPHFDDDGRMIGEPGALRSKVFGRYMDLVSEDEVAEALAVMNDLDLLVWYHVRDAPTERYVWSPKFTRHQTLRADRYGPSRFPAPPAWTPDADHPYSKMGDLKKQRPPRDGRPTARVPKRRGERGAANTPANLAYASRVYFVGDALGGPVKIGVSVEPERRMAELQVAYPHPLALLATFPGGTSEERQTHEQFAGLRLEGEWFRREVALVEFLASLGYTPINTAISSPSATAPQPRQPERDRPAVATVAQPHVTSPHVTSRHVTPPQTAAGAVAAQMAGWVRSAIAEDAEDGGARLAELVAGGGVSRDQVKAAWLNALLDLSVARDEVLIDGAGVQYQPGMYGDGRVRDRFGHVWATSADHHAWAREESEARTDEVMQHAPIECESDAQGGSTSPDEAGEPPIIRDDESLPGASE